MLILLWTLIPIGFALGIGNTIVWFKNKPEKDKVVESRTAAQPSSWIDESGKYHIRSYPDYVTCSNLKCNAVVAAFKGDKCPNCGFIL